MSDIEKIRIDGTNYDVADTVARNGLSTFRGDFQKWEDVVYGTYLEDIFGSTTPTNNDYIIVHDTTNVKFQLTATFTPGTGSIFSSHTSVRLQIDAPTGSKYASTTTGAYIKLKLRNDLYVQGYIHFRDTGSVSFYSDEACTIPTTVKLGEDDIETYSFTGAETVTFTYTDTAPYMFVYRGTYSGSGGVGLNGWKSVLPLSFLKETDYDELYNKPQINGFELNGDCSLGDIGAASESDLDDVEGRVWTLEGQVGTMTFWHGTLAEYNNISVKDANTLYVIKG